MKEFYDYFFSWIKKNGMLFLFGIILFSLTYFWKEKIIGFRWFLYYCSIIILISSLKIPINKFTKVFYFIIFFPIIIFKFLEPILLSLICLVFHAGVYLILGVFLAYMCKMEILNLTRNAILYISLTLGSIIILLFGKYVIKYTLYIFNNDHKPYMQELNFDFIQLLLNKDVFKLSVYSMYFIILILSSMSSFEVFSLVYFNTYRTPILQSFVSFIAFERVVNNTEILSEIKKKLKEKIISIWFGSFLPITPTYYIQITGNNKNEKINFLSKEEYSDFFTVWKDELNSKYLLWQFSDFSKEIIIENKRQLKRLIDELKLFEGLKSQSFSKILLKSAQIALEKEQTLCCFSLQMKNIRIKEVALSDIEQLQTISRQTFFETFSAVNTEENMTKYLEEDFSLEKLTSELNDKNSAFYFATLDNEVIGYLKLNFGQSQTELQDNKGLQIERIYVLKEFHGENIGQLLYEKAMEVAHQSNADYVWLGIWEKNPRAIRFYKKNGFIEFDKHIFRLGDDEQTDIMMKLELKDN